MRTLGEPEFMKRLRVEIDELDVKIERLNYFLQNSNDDMDKTSILMMQIQYQAMCTYRESVRARMEYMGMFEDEQRIS